MQNFEGNLLEVLDASLVLTYLIILVFVHFNDELADFQLLNPVYLELIDSLGGHM